MSNKDRVSIQEAAEALGWPPQKVHHVCKRGGVLKVKVNGRTYISLGELKKAAAAVEAGTHKVGKRRTTAGGSDDGEREPGAPKFKPFEQDPRLVVWNKGVYRGWAVAAVTDCSEELVTLITDYGRTVHATQDKLVEDIAAGRTFFLEPHQVLRLVELQLFRIKDRDKADGIGEIIKALDQVVVALEALKLKRGG